MPGSSTAGGRARPEVLARLVPAGRDAAEERTLDLDRGPATSGDLARLPEGAYDLIWGRSAFCRATRDWPRLLLEARRLLAPGGALAAGLGSPKEFEELTGVGWDEDRIGMTVLADHDGRPIAFFSEWWSRAHWGRAFEVEAVDRADAERWLALRPGPRAPSAEELQRPEAGEDRELTAALANRDLIAQQIERLDRRHRAGLDALREEAGRELMRRSFDRAHTEWAARGPDSPATDLAAAYEATLSWRVTRPMRAVGRALRNLRHRRSG